MTFIPRIYSLAGKGNANHLLLTTYDINITLPEAPVKRFFYSLLAYDTKISVSYAKKLETP